MKLMKYLIVALFTIAIIIGVVGNANGIQGAEKLAATILIIDFTIIMAGASFTILKIKQFFLNDKTKNNETEI